MRIIDADEFYQKLHKEGRHKAELGTKFGTACASEVDVVILLLKNAPTIDPEELRPKGEWTVTKEHNDILDMEVVKYTCSACKEYRLSASGLSQATNYCPNCGAEMRGAE